MNKTRRMLYQALAIALFISVAVLRPFGMGSGTLWAGILAAMVPYIGWRAATVLLVAESLMLTFSSFVIPVIGNLFLYLPVISFVWLFSSFFIGCLIQVCVMYVGADLLGIRKKLDKAFP